MIIFIMRDAEILYAFPRPPSDLATIIRYYMFINRVDAPTYEEISGCLLKAMKAGIVHADCDRYSIPPTWYDKIHLSDKSSDNEIESMLSFAEQFVGVPFPEVAIASGVPTAQHYSASVTIARS